MKRQRGAALLTAMVTVTVVASLAATAMWRQTQLSAMEAAERQRQQAAWVLAGALDWSRLILRSDVSSIDHLGEPWAVLLQETRLSSFLSADKSSAASEDLARQPDVFLSGQIHDAQGRMNFSHLIVEGKVVPAALKAFERLFEQLGLPQAELTSVVIQWALADAVAGGRRATGDALQPLRPQRLPDLLRLGLTEGTLARLEPHVTLIQTDAPLNLNTAGVEAISAVLDLPRAEASKLVRARSLHPFANLAAAEHAAGVLPGRFKPDQAGISSRHFLVLGRLRLGDFTVQEHSLLRRDTSGVSIVWRERELPQSSRLANREVSAR